MKELGDAFDVVDKIFDEFCGAVRDAIIADGNALVEERDELQEKLNNAIEFLEQIRDYQYSSIDEIVLDTTNFLGTL